MDDKFLKSVSNWCFNHATDVTQTYWVFPNRRSCVYFENFFKDIYKSRSVQTPIWLPKSITINDLITESAQITLAEPFELIALLYRIYGKHSGSAESFDQFYIWGEMIINDFNDIDKYLVDPQQIFMNLKSINEMDDKLLYLTDEQIETIQRFFSSLTVGGITDLKKKFLEVWEVLLPVFLEFNQLLTEKNLAYEGFLYKRALMNIEKSADESLPFNTICFAGFNAITPAEEKIFENLKNRKLAYFFWDYDNLFIEDQSMEAGLFIRKHLQKFPEPVDFLIERDLLPNKTITVISSPTDSGQIFKASQFLATLKNSEISDTAYVLSDESLLLEAIQTLPETIDELNITMGYPFSSSLTWDFLNHVVQLQLNSTTSEKKGFRFYHKNVLQLLYHPFLQKIDAGKARDYIQQITLKNIIQVSPSLFEENPIFKTLFSPFATAAEFCEYLSNCFALFQTKIWGSENQDDKIEQEFAMRIYTTTVQLNKQISRHQISLTLPTFLVFLRQYLKNSKIPFEGEPVKGLQLMGFLETRNLDFKNVIIISVNEGLLPSSGQGSSFIPYSLRRGFGLPTRELHDAMYAYYFYRLLQRSEQCLLFYNSGLKGLNSEDKSRYIYQLLFNPKFQVKSITDNPLIEVSIKQTISITKDKKVLSVLYKFTEPDSGKKLSPSALSAYLACPLRFYFRSIATIREPDEIEEQIDARLFGNIFHRVAEKFYQHFFSENQSVSAELLDSLISQNTQIMEWIRDAFKETVVGKNLSTEFQFEGKNLIVSNIIYQYLVQLVQIDKRFTPFYIRGIEKEVEATFQVPANQKIWPVRIGGTIDRMENNISGLRIIDYKTGSDNLSFNDLDQLFQQKSSNGVKAVFQTFVYSLIVAQNFPNEPTIIPSVYQVKEFYSETSDFQVSSNKYQPFKSGNFKDIEPEFKEKFTALLAEIFDVSIPFTQTSEPKNCEHCPYRKMCGR